MSSASRRRASISKQRGGGDVFEVHAAEAGGEHFHGPDDLIGVLGIETDRPRVHVTEALEQGSLALHDGYGRNQADVAETEDRRAVRDDGNGVALDREVVRVFRALCERRANAGDARGIRHRELIARP